MDIAQAAFTPLSPLWMDHRLSRSRPTKLMLYHILMFKIDPLMRGMAPDKICVANYKWFQQPLDTYYHRRRVPWCRLSTRLQPVGGRTKVLETLTKNLTAWWNKVATLVICVLHCTIGPIVSIMDTMMTMVTVA